jgi:LacI family transcriptional regulator
MVTIRDVAAESGVSITTVSFVLNNSKLARTLRESTRARVREAVARLGYRPNALAQTLRSKRSQTIGVIVFDILDPYCTQVLSGIQNALHRAGPYVPLVIDIQNNRRRFKPVVRMLVERQVEGLIALGNPFAREEDLEEALRVVQAPTVIIGREMKKVRVNSLSTNNAVGAAMALKHLAELGHKRIAFIRGPSTFVDSGERWSGILERAARCGLTLDRGLVVDLKRHVSYYEGGYELTRKLLQSGRPFTALLAYDDLTAFGAVRALTGAGLGVPADCSVIGFDDVLASSFYNPPLTTVSQTLELLGSTGVQMLLRRSGGRTDEGATPGPGHRTLEPQLVVRASTAPPTHRAR